jgi:integrase
MAATKKGSGLTRRGFYRRGRIIWYRTDPVEGVPRSTKSKTWEGAQEWLAERERLAANPRYAAAHRETLGVWVKRMLADKQQLKSAATFEFYSQKAGHLIRIFGEDCPLVRIDSDAVDDFKNRRFAEGAHHYTISKEFNALRQTLKKAARAGVYSHDLTTLFPLEFGLGYKPRETVLTEDQERLLQMLLPPHQWAAVAWILGTSSRLSEVLAAQPGDWDPEADTVLIRGTKTEKSYRVIPVISVTRPYLEVSAPYLPFRWPRMTKDLADVCNKNGLPHINCNDLRRTCATRLIEAGAEPYFVTRITGHSDLKMLKSVYDRSAIDVAAEALEGQLEARRTQRENRKKEGK